VIQEMPGAEQEKSYDPRELAGNLIDWVDADEERWVGGGFEDDAYQTRSPPYRAANRPLRSVDELQLVEGFDGSLLEGLRPYVTVHPWVGGDGINPNTAPPHVLGLLYHGVSGDYRLADAVHVKHLIDVRKTGATWCDETATDERCRSIQEIFPHEIYPPPSWTSDVFTVVSRVTVGDVTRTVEAVLDRSQPQEPAVVAWRLH
jgi:general secretion pathway protein K